MHLVTFDDAATSCRVVAALAPSGSPAVFVDGADAASTARAVAA